MASGQQSQEETLPGEWSDSFSKRSVLLEQGSHLGRYLVLRRLGGGGMGDVYAAYDPTLDRQVALKLVRFDDGEGAEAAKKRLAREAQAMAKIRHPNVIVVHDVDTHEGRLYIAMELIEGVTLTKWLDGEPGWEAVLDCYRRAGEGLWAAHRRSVVHRDFKPENVMVDEDGRVVVLDFGLARGSSRAVEPDSLVETEEVSTSLLDHGMTRAGTLPGTPAYMSPEQFAGAEATEFSDQFSFCVSLYQGLYGERPFAGDSTAAVVFNISQGSIRPAASRTIPRWVRAAVLRGLSARPEDRWPSMGALLEALDPKRRRRRRLAFGLVGVGVVSVGLGAAATTLLGKARQCTGGKDQLAAIWSDSTRAKADAHIASFERAGVGQTWALGQRELDAYVDTWESDYVDACEDTNVRKEQSTEALDLRMACLRRARVEFEATIEEILTIDESGLGHLHTLVRGLPDLERCRDAARLSGIEPPPPELAEKVESLQATIAQLRTDLRRGGAKPEPLFELEPEVVATGYLLLQAEFYKLLGDTLVHQRREVEGVANLERALELALASGSDELAIEILYSLVSNAQTIGNPNGARAYAGVAVGLAKGDVSPRLRRLSQLAVSRAQESAGAYDPAIETLRELLPAIPADARHERGLVYSELGTVLDTQDRLDEAREAFGSASKELRAVLGDRHAEIAQLEMMLGNIAMKQRDFDLAEEKLLLALEIDTAFFGAGHPATAGPRANLGTLYARLGRSEDAIREYEIVLDLIEADDPRVALIEQNLGVLLLQDEKYEEAEGHFRRTIEITTAAQGEDHPDLMSTHSTLGVTLEGLGRVEEAEDHHRKALRLALEAHGDSHTRTASYRIRVGHNLVEQGRAADAIALLELAAQSVPEGLEPNRRAMMHFDLGRAYWHQGKRAKSRAAAEEALEHVEAEGFEREIRLWIAEH